MPTPTLSPPSARQLLVDWANQQDHWIRAVAAEVLATRKPLPPASLEKVYAIYCAEKGLSDDAAPSVPGLSIGETTEEVSEDLRLLKLSGLTGVNALAADQSVVFNPRLTVLYGENAAGKTGYVRVLKRVAAVRSAEPVLGNFRTKSSGKPHALLEYALAGKNDTLDWNDEQGVPPLTRMNVFDSRSVTIHVDGDLTYVFTPSDLALFQHVHQAADATRAKLEAECEKAKPGPNTFLSRFERDRLVYQKIETLGASTDMRELDQLAVVQPGEEQQLEVIREKVESLRPETTNLRLQAAKADGALYRELAAAAGTVAQFDWTAYDAAVALVASATERYKEATERAFANENITGGLSAEWQAFVQAGESYLAAHEHAEYPGERDACVYCHQALGPAALALIRKYRDYANNQHKKDLDGAIESLRQRSVVVSRLNIASLHQSLQKKMEGAKGEDEPGKETPTQKLHSASATFLADLAAVHGEVSKGQSVVAGELVEAARGIATAAEAAAKKAEDVVESLTKEATEREKAFKEESEKLRTLKNRVMLRKLLPDIKVYVTGAHWHSRAQTVSKRFAGLLRTLTNESSRASEQLLNQDFERLFREECGRLRAPQVDLDFAGRKGQAARKKVLVAEHQLSDILSEGEQKVIALADFLAESMLRQTVAPIVFDDPVNSLDYRRIREIVDRVVSMSATRQVVVFTHNIWFATGLLAKFEKNKEGCTFYNIQQTDTAIGVITSGTHPRWDTPTELEKRVQKHVEAAGRETGEIQTAMVESAYGVLRSWCEVVVEQELLAGVSQRYQPNVMMTKLPQIKADRLPAALDVISPLFEKACRMMPDHSQPLETLSVRPTLTELQEDWRNAQAARLAYVKD